MIPSANSFFFFSILLLFFIKINPCFAQNTNALAYFSLQYPTEPTDIESMQVVLQKNNSKNIKCVYQFDAKNQDFQGVTMYQTYQLDANAKATSILTLSQNAKRDTLNKVEQKYEYNTNKQKTCYEYHDRRGDEPNRTEEYSYDAQKNLFFYCNQNPISHDTLIYTYDSLQRVSGTLEKKYNIEFETQKQTQTAYIFANDTLEIQEKRYLPAGFFMLAQRNFYFKKDTVLLEYQQKSNEPNSNLVGKYFINKAKKIVKYLKYDPKDVYLPLQTLVYVYYPSGQLRSIYDYKGAGNLQKITQYRPTAEIQSIEYVAEKTKREYFYHPLTGLPVRADMYQKGVKKGQINYVFF